MRDSRSPAASTTVSAGAIRPISVSTRSRVRAWEGVRGATGRRFYAPGGSAARRSRRRSAYLFRACRPTSLPRSAVSAGSPPWRRWCPGSRCTGAASGRSRSYSDAPDNNEPDRAPVPRSPRRRDPGLRRRAGRRDAAARRRRARISTGRSRPGSPTSPSWWRWWPASTGLSAGADHRGAGRGAGESSRATSPAAPPQTARAAEDAFEDPALLIPQYVGISAVLALAFWLVKGSLDAMRVGLLTRFMGVVRDRSRPGLRASVRLADPARVADRAGRAVRRDAGRAALPPAWETGEALPWPSAEERRAAAARSRPPQRPRREPGRNGEVDPVGPGVRPAGRRRGRRDPG